MFILLMDNLHWYLVKASTSFHIVLKGRKDVFTHYMYTHSCMVNTAKLDKYPQRGDTTSIRELTEYPLPCWLGGHSEMLAAPFSFRYLSLKLDRWSSNLYWLEPKSNIIPCDFKAAALSRFQNMIDVDFCFNCNLCKWGCFIKCWPRS